jgi:hypothetical protein
MLEATLGHELDIVMHILGDFVSISTTFTIIYPTATIFSASSDQTRESPVKAADHIAFSGLLKYGAVVSATWCGGYTSTPGRTQFV